MALIYWRICQPEDVVSAYRLRGGVGGAGWLSGLGGGAVAAHAAAAGLKKKDNEVGGDLRCRGGEGYGMRSPNSRAALEFVDVGFRKKVAVFFVFELAL
jgi:hypothetical protein